jgi:hypothetical protein
VAIDTLDILRRCEANKCRDAALSDDDQRIIDDELDQMMRKVAAHSDWESADQDLRHLGTLQEMLATLAFKHRVRLTTRQREIVRAYDRSDVAEIRQKVFLAIKRGDFPWSLVR